MLTFEEFMDKKRIILAKPLATYIFQKNCNNLWTIFEIVNDIECNDFHCTIYGDVGAYGFYKTRMESFGFKQFNMIIE